jgi:ribonucleoside-triphosphate reductase
MQDWSNQARVVYLRTYARKDHGRLENWADTVDRVIAGNTRNFKVSPEEKARLRYFMMNRKAGPAGRGLWFSGAPSQARIGGAALCNCWFVTGDDWMNLVIAQDLLMLGGGVGLSVEHRFVSKLPKIKSGVRIVHHFVKDADFIVPDSREGWNELTRRVFESFFVTGKSFSFSTVCVRGAGEPINGFGGTSSGPSALISLVEDIQTILGARAGKHARPIDVADLICAIADMVVAGNVRRSAIILLGDPWDKEYLTAKRWDLGVVPGYRARANFSVVASDVEDLHPLYWKTYEAGEAFGLVNRENIQKYGRMGELLPDSAIGVNPCGEATLENLEPCNLQEISLPHIESEAEFIEAARLMHRWGKRVALERYHYSQIDAVVKKNMRIGTGLTGCLMSPLFMPEILDHVYEAVRIENPASAKEYNSNPSIRTTVIKPSGTRSKQDDMQGYEGIHAALSRYIIQRIRFSASDPMIPRLKAAGHVIEPEARLDGTVDLNTLVVDFYQQAPNGFPVVDEGFDTWKQLDVLKLAQTHWSDQAVSVSVYYKREEISQIKAWLADNLKNLKTISFMLQQDHGFKQAPKEPISKEQFEILSSKIKSIDTDGIGEGAELQGTECQNGMCPIK